MKQAHPSTQPASWPRIVNEAGASVYSASKLAAEEFPDHDVAARGAASIARRLQDPLAELVKIDPKSIGVGLTGVVEDCVNRVGVDVNTASAALLSYISGINKTIAKNIVTYREENGTFRNRRALLKVPKLGPKAFEQSAGFLRISGGEEPLDMTGVHPESYDAARKLLEGLGYSEKERPARSAQDLRPSMRNLSPESSVSASTRFMISSASLKSPAATRARSWTARSSAVMSWILRT